MIKKNIFSDLNHDLKHWLKSNDLKWNNSGGTWSVGSHFCVALKTYFTVFTMFWSVQILFENILQQAALGICSVILYQHKTIVFNLAITMLMMFMMMMMMMMMIN